jgi:hypothetical protein
MIENDGRGSKGCIAGGHDGFESCEDTDEYTLLAICVSMDVAGYAILLDMEIDTRRTLDVASTRGRGCP